MREAAPQRRFYAPAELLDKLLSLAGRSIAGVCDHDDCVSYHRHLHTEQWNRHGEWADVAHSIELTFEDGEVLALRSRRQATVRQRGLVGANHSVLESEAYRAHQHDIGTVWDVSQDSRWAGVLDVPLARVRPYYAPLGPEDRASVPCRILDLAFDFADGQCVYLAAHVSDVRADGLARQGHQTAAVFGESGARRLGLGPFGPLAQSNQPGLAPVLTGRTGSPDLAPSLAKYE